jgi:hypothetical protein
VSLFAETRKKRPFLSFTNRFLEWAPGMRALMPSDSATVNTASCATVSAAILSSAKSANSCCGVRGGTFDTGRLRLPPGF